MATNELKNNNLEKITELRHYLHAHPDLSLQESETIRILQDFLFRNTDLEIVDKKSWFYVVKEAKGEPTVCPIAFRADMDALLQMSTRILHG